MRPDDIDSWYETEKQHIEEEFLKGMEKGGNPDELRKVFDVKLKAAIDKYTKEYQKALKPDEFKKKRQQFAKRFNDYSEKITSPIKKGMDNLSGTFKELKLLTCLSFQWGFS